MRTNPVLLLVLTLGLMAAVWLPLVTVAPNRLLSGQGIGFGPVLQASVQALGCLPLPLLLGLALWPRPARWVNGLVALLAGGLIWGLLALVGLYAGQVAQTGSVLARTSLGSGFWLVALALCLALMDALQRLQAGLALRLLAWLGLLLGLAGLLASGGCDQLSIMKEFANRSDTFLTFVLRHLQIVLLTLLPTLCLGLPLGWALQRYTRLQPWLLPPLNIIQTIPSIALFGLLMVPLAGLASAWPILARWGVSGIGLAPAVLALTLYSLLPVVRSTQAGLAQVPAAVREAGLGLGMSRWRLFWQAELPLAAPLILAGVRTATLQTVGLAAVAALIGAGGLGAIMFDGLFGSAQDLVLLGVLPIIGLALLFDVGFKLLAGLTSPSQPCPQGGKVPCRDQSA